MYPLHPMPNRATLSVAGLYSWDSDLFENLHLPDGVSQTLIVANILMECAELTVIYPDWQFMHDAIDAWSTKELPIWQKIYDLENMDYNPIENYDRYEDEVENTSAKVLDSEHNGSVGKTLNTGSRVGRNDGMNNAETVNSVAGFNTDTLAAQNKSANNSTDFGHTVDHDSSVADGKASETKVRNGINDQTRRRGSRIHGNIGVTTTQQMMEQELAILPKVHVDDYIINSFKERFCILVY